VPLLAMRLAQAFDAAGLPAGVLNLLIGPGAMGNDLVSHPELDGLTFTGSTGVGRALAANTAARGVPMQAEMGGKNAAVVLADADLELASEQVLFGAFRSTGQKCTATSRLIVAEAVADEFLDRLRARLDAWTVGDPTDPDVHMGPLVNEAARKSVLAGIADSVQQGARVVAGGGAAGTGAYDGGMLAEGAFVAPTVLEVSEGSNPGWREEFFGPVLTVRRAANAEEAFGLANDSEFGLSAAVFTQDIGRTLEAIDELDVGILHINSESAGADPHVPFGGAKKSGYGPKEQGAAAREFFTHTTTVYLRGGQPA
jgi:aldehyde dehydrogenase (NAD+)